MRLLRFARNDTNFRFLRNHQYWLAMMKHSIGCTAFSFELLPAPTPEPSSLSPDPLPREIFTPLNSKTVQPGMTVTAKFTPWNVFVFYLTWGEFNWGWSFTPWNFSKKTSEANLTGAAPCPLNYELKAFICRFQPLCLVPCALNPSRQVKYHFPCQSHRFMVKIPKITSKIPALLSNSSEFLWIWYWNYTRWNRQETSRLNDDHEVPGWPSP